MQVEKYICGKNNVSDMEEELCVCVLEKIFLYAYLAYERFVKFNFTVYEVVIIYFFRSFYSNEITYERVLYFFLEIEY